jgi:AraC-like DNA-binding protein
MMNTTTVSSVYVSLLANYLQGLQTRRPDLQLRQISIPEFRNPDIDRIDLVEIEKLIAKIKVVTGDKRIFSLQLGTHIHPSDYGIFCYALMNCSSLGQAAQLVSRYVKLLNQTFDVKLKVGDRSAFFILSTTVDNISSRILVELQLLSTMRMAQFLSGSQFSNSECVSEIHFQHSAMGDIANYESTFGCRVLFGQPDNRIVLNKDALSIPIRSASPKMLAMLLKKIQRLEDRMNNSVAFSMRVYDFVEANLGSSNLPSAEIAANHFNISLSTLKKYLHKEGLSYTAICDEVRHKLALKLVVYSTEQLQSISDCLGFSNTSAFYRAFRRWTGATPAEFRRNSLITSESNEW